MLVHVAGVEDRRIRDPGDGLRRDDDRCGQEAAFGTELNPARAFVAQRGREDAGRIVERCGNFGRVQRHFGAGHAGCFGRRIRVRRIAGNAIGVDRCVDRQIEEAIVGCVQDAQAIGLRVQRQGRVGDAVDDRRVVEGFHAHRDVRHTRVERRLAPLEVRVAGGVVVGIGNRAIVDGGGRRPEPRAVGPAAKGVDTRGVARVLRRHVDMRHPQVALAAPARHVPGRVLHFELCLVGHEGLVLDDQRDLVGRDRAAVDQRLFGGVRDQVAGCLARIDVQARNAPRMVVVEHQARALLVGVEEGQGAGTGIGHVRHITHADTLGVGCVVAGRRDPLVRRAVADPRVETAMQM